MAQYDKQEPIAIIGAACRFSGEVSSMGNLWDMISRERTGHCKIPVDRWNADVWYHPDPDRKGSIAVKHGYFLKQDVSHFDAPFFSTTAKEAAAMDPMKRLLLEVSYESIENAGIPVETLMNSPTGCYVGCMTNDYELLSAHDIQDMGHAAASANSEAMTSNRVSWFFGLQGPSLTLDTACSSSLYALHLACQSLRLHETNLSLVAGVNLLLAPVTYQQLSAMHMLSPEGVSHTFDDRANGYGRGEGFGSLIVKRLSDALRDGDTIRAVIRGTGANADGKTPSITQPSSLAQADLIKRTYEAAGLPQTATQYFESHGTGTPVGDPIELEAIASTMGAARTAAGMGPLYVGSIKPNVGHTEGCSGLAGVFKAIVCLENGMLAPTYGVERVNPKLKFTEWNLALPPRVMEWPECGQRRISINSFGFGGANAHAILDDAHHYLKERGLVGNHNTTVRDDSDGSDSGIGSGAVTPLLEQEKDIKRLFVFSTKDQAGIQRLATTYANALEKAGLDKEDPYYLSNLAYTLSTRRSHLDFRSFSVASTLRELNEQLSKGLPKIKRFSRQDKNLIFVFTGQGAQWPAMGQQLLSNATFKKSMQTSQDYLTELGCEWDTFEELSKTTNSNINLPQYSQTLCTVLQVALVDMLRSWKVIPRATVGHSSGEIAAAYAASYITHADAVKIAYVRGFASAAVIRKGAMMAVGLSQAQALEYLAKVPHESAVVACINSPSSVTLSGDVDVIDTLEKLISDDGKFARKLKVKTAYHSPHMRAVAESYLQRMGQIATQAKNTTDDGNKTVMYSSLTGKLVEPEELTAKYWVGNMCAAVEFSAAVMALLGHTTPSAGGRSKNTPVRWGGIVEIGPHAALQGPLQQIITASTNKPANEAVYMSMLSRGKDANKTALAACGQLWALGHEVDLSVVNEYESGRARPKALVDLPPYPWNHSKGFWHEPYITRSSRYPSAPRTDMLGLPEDMQNSMEPRWRNYLRINENPWIEDHQITGTILYPGAGLLIMALEGALQTQDPARKLQGVRFRNVRFMRGLVVPSGDEAAVETRLSLRPHKTIPGQFEFTIYSTTTGSSWTKHCHGTIALEYQATRASEVEDSAQDAAWAQRSAFYEELVASEASHEIDVDAFYDHLETIGMQYGPLFRNVVSLSAIPSISAAYAAIVIPDTKSVMPDNFEYPHVIHPATMDAIFHLLLAAFNDGKPVEEAAVPYGIDDMFVAAEQPQGAGGRYHGYGQQSVKSEGGREIIGELIVSDETFSTPKLIVKGFALRQVTSAEDVIVAVADGPDAISKCARINWVEDVDFIKNGEDVTRLRDAKGSGGHQLPAQLSLWLDRLAHKKAVGEVLLVLNEESTSTSDILRDISARASRKGFKSITAIATYAAGLDTLSSFLTAPSDPAFQLWNSSSNEELPAAKGAYDLALVLGDRSVRSQIEPLAKLQQVLSPSGHVVIVQNEASQSDIKTTLQSVGFANPIAVAGHGTSNLFIASASVFEAPAVPSEVYILLPSPAPAQVSSLSANLTSLLSSSNITVHTATLSSTDMSHLAGKYIISLLEVESPLIYSWSEAQFTSFKSLVSSVRHLLWLTHGSVLDSWAAGVEFAPAQGLLRVLRNEYTLTTLPHLDLSAAHDPKTPGSASLVLDVWRTSLIEGSEMEYAELDGVIHVPRAVGDAGFDEELQLANGSAKPVGSLIHGSGKALKLTSSMVGGEFLWVDDEDVSLPLDPTQIEVEVEFVGLNASDVSDESSGLGREAAGIVSRCGEKVKSVFVGQRVAIFGADMCRTHVRQDETLVAPLPAAHLATTITPEQAVALPTVFITAQYALLEVAGLSKGQSVLIHSATSALGQAVVQVAKHVGAEVFALVGTKEEKNVLLEQYGISPERIFDSALQNFVFAIVQATNGAGVDAIFSEQPGPAVLPSLATLADFGCFLDLSNDNPDVPEISLPSTKRNASLVRIDMDRVAKLKPRVIKTLFQRTFDFFYRCGAVAPISPTTVFPVTDVAKALDVLKAEIHGKVVLSLNKDALVLTPPPPAPELVLDKDATYVLAGGLGALGLDIANMMIRQGAKHLVFLSRSGGSKNEKDLEGFRAQGVQADAFKCDVSNSQNVKDVFEQLRADGRVVKGVVQCAMVLEDTIFENMTHAKWSRAIMPKTHGSHNLLNNLSSTDSPFYILLSSITGVIGNTAQANYASGNTFEDGLAHYARTHLNIPATSIDVGLVSDSSHFTSAGEFGDLENYLHKYQHGWAGLQCSLEELSVVLKAVMRGSTANGSSIPAQLVLGLGDNLIREQGTTGFQRDQKFNLRVTDSAGGAGADGVKGGPSVTEQLSKATSLAEAQAVVEESIKATIAQAVGVDIDEVDGQKPLFDFGVDSLKAVEIRNRTLREMQSDISVFDLLSATPLTELAGKIASRSALVKVDAASEDM